MRLETTDSELHSLELMVERRRRPVVTVSTESLRHLLRDHITLNTEVQRKHGRLPETQP